MSSLRNKHLKLVFLFLFAVFIRNLHSQENIFINDNPRYWLNAGVGGSSSGLSGGLSLSYEAGKNLFTFRYIGSSKYGEDKLGGYTTAEKIRDIGPLYGRIIKGKFGYASISGGINLVTGVKHGEFLGIINWVNTYEKIRITTIGIPLEAQFFFTPVSFLGIGATAFANLNPEKSFWGLLLCIQFGKLR